MEANMKTYLRILVVTLSLLLIGVLGTASADTYQLDYNNVIGSGGPWAQVVLTDVGSAGVSFDVTTYGDATMRDFYFNTDLTTLTAGDISITTPDYSATVDFNSIAADGFGKFDVSIDKTGTHDVSELIFTIAIGRVDDFYFLSDGNAGHGNGHFAVQILPSPTTQLTFFARDNGTPQVPEPSMLMLFGSGLLGLGFFGRKKFKK
jgi:hypothetical protein